MSDPIYEIKDDPTYETEIRALQDSDPAQASTVFNPLMTTMINNTHAVKLTGEETAESVTELAGRVEDLEDGGGALDDHIDDPVPHVSEEDRERWDNPPSGVPEDHNHTIAQVTNLQSTLDGKAPNTHAHTIAQVTALQSTLDGKAPSTHNHTISQVTDLQARLDGMLVAESGTWTPTLTGATLTNVYGYYYRTGKLCNLSASFYISSVSSFSTRIGGIPFSVYNSQDSMFLRMSHLNTENSGPPGDEPFLVSLLWLMDGHMVYQHKNGDTYYIESWHRLLLAGTTVYLNGVYRTT